MTATILITIKGENYEDLVTVRRDGSVVYGEGVDLDDASRRFWDAIAASIPPTHRSAAPHLLAAKDAEIERLRGALVSIECAAERADRKGYDLDPVDVLDDVRRGLTSEISEAGA